MTNTIKKLFFILSLTGVFIFIACSDITYGTLSLIFNSSALKSRAGDDSCGYYITVAIKGDYEDEMSAKNISSLILVDSPADTQITVKNGIFSFKSKSGISLQFGEEDI